MLRDWVIKGLGMSSLVYATGHIKDPVPLVEKRRGLSPGGRFPPSFIHQVVIITGLNKLQLCSRPEDGLRCRQGVKPPLNQLNQSIEMVLFKYDTKLGTIKIRNLSADICWIMTPSVIISVAHSLGHAPYTHVIPRGRWALRT